MRGAREIDNLGVLTVVGAMLLNSGGHELERFIERRRTPHEGEVDILKGDVEQAVANFDGRRFVNHDRPTHEITEGHTRHSPLETTERVDSALLSVISATKPSATTPVKVAA